MTGNPRSRCTRRVAAVAAAALLAALPACGGGADEPAGTQPRTGTATGPAAVALPPATTPARFAGNFERITGVRLLARPDGADTRFAVPPEPDREPRLGVYAIRWSSDAAARDGLLGAGPPDAQGRWWKPDGAGSWTVARPVGSHLVAEGPPSATRTPDASWLRLERAVAAASSGDLRALPAAEQPCRDRGLNPLHGPTGACSVKGMPVTFVDALDELDTPLVQARVRGVETAAVIEDPYGVLDSRRAAGRFVVVAFAVRNAGGGSIPSLHPQLHLAGRTFEQDAQAHALMPRSRSLPLEPGATFETWAAFDVPRELAAQASTGALVLGTGADAHGAPSSAVEQGWIRLLAAPLSLPDPPDPAAPQGGARRYRPPPIPLVRGSGEAIGATVRARYAASTFVPLPSTFAPGGIPVGSRAGICRVPPVTAAIRGELRAAIRRQTPRGTLQPLTDDAILLADCGAAGRWALLTWTQVHGGRTVDWIDELRDDGGGRWTGTARGVLPGCRMPQDAAAVWQVDVTACRSSAAPRAPPRTTPAPPPRTAPQPAPRARERLPEGSSRA